MNISQSSPATISASIVHRMAPASSARSNAGHAGSNENRLSRAARSLIQCQLVCATSADSRTTPSFSATTCRNSRPRAGTSAASTSSCPSSTPRLNARSDVSRCEPANWSVSRSANEKPNPCTSPNPNVTSHRRRSRTPTMFSNAIQTIDAAISVSTRGGNQRASGASSNADAISVTEWAAVNDVTMAARGRSRRNGITRQARNSRWSVPSRMCSKPRATNRRAAWSHRGSSRTSPGFPEYSNARTAPSGSTNRSTVIVRMPSRPSVGSIENCDRSDRIGYSNSASSIACCQKISVSAGSGGPVTWASASA